SRRRRSGSTPWSAARQLEREAAARSGGALEVDAPAVRLDDVAHDGEPEAGRADVAAVAGLDEAVEDALLLIGRDAAPGVAHRDDDRPVGGPHLDSHRSARGRVAERVGEEVRERPRELGRIAGDGERAAGDRRLEGDALLAGLQREE